MPYQPKIRAQKGLRCKVNGIEYKSVAEAARQTQIPVYTLTKLMRSTKPENSEYQFVYPGTASYASDPSHASGLVSEVPDECKTQLLRLGFIIRSNYFLQETLTHRLIVTIPAPNFFSLQVLTKGDDGITKSVVCRTFEGILALQEACKKALQTELVTPTTNVQLELDLEFPGEELC